MAIEKMSNRSMKIIGTLSEIGLIREDRDITLADGKKVKGEAIHSPIGKPSLVVEVNGMPIPVETMWTNSITKEGKTNPKFKAMETIMNEYVPRTKATKENLANRICITGMLGLNEYPTDQGEWKSGIKLDAMNITRNVKEDDEDMADINVSGLVKSIRPEIIKEEETGRQILEMFTFEKENGSVVIKPHAFIVPEEVVDDFDGWAEKGDVLEVSIEINIKQIGGQVKETRGFGRKAQTSTGFTITELLLCGAEPTNTLNDMELEETPWSMEDVKTLLNERQIMIDTKIKEKKEGGNKSKSSNGKASDSKKQGLSKRANVPTQTMEEDDDLPF